ncbi:DUF4440 domain-containing protein [Flagellimonas sp.]|uniref:nuclear transport factor 2 family protein n=1 Tax=Flagellimonas sp. TaxID=2058762 RepID=UPI003BA9C65A
MQKTKYILGMAIMLLSLSLQGQVAKDTELYKTLKSKDSILFDAAFNQCDVPTLESLFTEDFEFYHDRGGFTDGREAFLKSVRENCARRNPSEPQNSKRILVDGSLEVYPLYKDGELYGAIQHGVHTFEFLNDRKEYQKGDIAKFTHVWLLKDGQWKVKRELSYDHHAQTASKEAIVLSDSTLSSYVGDYESPQAGKVTITKDSDHLLLQSNGFEANLYPEAVNTFFLKERGTKFKFIKDNGHEVSKMIILENDTVVDEAKKI